jgi:hypothetical protein
MQSAAPHPLLGRHRHLFALDIVPEGKITMARAVDAAGGA